jgi:hypothetical protein
MRDMVSVLDCLTPPAKRTTILRMNST